ncbi:MAG TPA: PAS domain S-box protein [Gemmatimonadota bacterium]|jgi:PAS domain S-box-containing protein|nr:PAS domain S-box protein [Gemmatimonadota bacterium]
MGKRNEAARTGNAYLATLDKLPALVWRTAADGSCDFHNQAWLEFTGRTFGQELGAGWTEGVHPDDLAPLIERFERAFAAREPFEMEYRVRHRSGEYRRISDHAHPLYDNDGNFDGYLGISFDISERERGHEGEVVFRSIFEDATVGMARTDPEGRFLLANAAYQKMLGYTMDELRDLTLETVTHPKDWDRHRELFRKMIAGEIQSFDIRKRYIRKDGSVLWVHASDSAVFDAEGNLRFAQAITRDIDDIKRAEETLRESEAELAEAQAIAHVGSWSWDIAADEVRWSTELYRIYGLVPGTMIKYDDFLERVAPEDRERVERIVTHSYETGEPFDYLHDIVRPDGTVRTIHARGRVLFDEDGHAVRMSGTGQDVTDRVRVERELRRSGESYRMLAENVNEMIIRFTPEGSITYASPAALRILGYMPDEVVGRQGREFLHSEDLEEVVQAHRSMLHGTDPPAVLSRMLHKDGHVVWMETTTRAVRDPDTGEVESIVAVSRDVTENVRAARTSRVLHEVAVAANEADSSREALQTALALVCEHTGWPYGHAHVPPQEAIGQLGSLDIWHVDDPGRHARLRAIMGMSDVSNPQGILEDALKGGAVHWCSDVSVDPEFRRMIMVKHLGIRAAFAFPIRSGNESIAVLEFFSEQIEERDETMVRLLNSIGDQLGEVLRRKRTEQALRASEERFRALAESANDAIITVDERGIVVHCNPSTEHIFGYTCNELLGQPIDRLLVERRSNGGQGGFHGLMGEAAPSIDHTVELTGRKKDGEQIPIEMSLSSWETEEGSFVTGILRDITARKAAEAELAEKMEELAHSNAELALFTYIASHDLREPLRTVGSNLQLLERQIEAGPESEAGKQFSFAMGGVRRMQALIDDLLVYTRVGTEGKPFEKVDSSEAVREAMTALSAAIEESGAEIAIGRLPHVIADRFQFVQLFQNLLSNAIKFHRHEPPRIDIEASADDRDWTFTVRDRGIGVDPRYADQVFAIFQRLHSGNEYPGTGIGLAVCRKIVERHGGRIWVEPAPEGGSAFRFTIPARRG